MKGLKRLISDQALSLVTEMQIDSRILKSLIQNLYNKDWVVYTKKTFAGVNHVVLYLGRYSHRVAIASYCLPTSQPLVKQLSSEINLIIKSLNL